MKHIYTLLLMLVALSPGVARAGTADVLLDSLPKTWELESTYFQTTPSEDNWWNNFGDPILTELIKKAVENNYNVLAAQKRIEVASQVCRQTKAGYYPTLSADAGWTREQTANTVHSEHSHPTVISHFALGLSMNWELDVFGRIQSQLKADKANYRASVADYDATLVSLCSNLAKAYFELRMAQAEYEVTSRNIAVSEEQKKLAVARYEAGLRPYLDVVQADITLTQTKATLPQLNASITTALNEIALLVGEYPEQLSLLKEAMPLPETPPPGMVTDPAGLLRRRPDIVAAEQQLAATAAQIGIAKKDFLPTLSVSANIGTQGQALKDLFGSGSLYYTVMPTLSWTIFDGMARNAQLAQARLNMEAQIDQYNLTVMTAIQEVNNAMISWQSSSDQLVYQQMLLRQARQQVEIQIDRYRQGLAAFSDIAAAQVTVLQYENSVISTHATQLADLVTLYSALGGGF